MADIYEQIEKSYIEKKSQLQFGCYVNTKRHTYAKAVQNIYDK